MTKKVVIAVTAVVLAICLISGGCFPAGNHEPATTWKDLVDLLPEKDKDQSGGNDSIKNLPEKEPPEVKETISVQLYFAGSSGQSLLAEDRVISKQEGIARSTLQELFKGPSMQEHLTVVPAGTKLKDINIKSDGLCIVDLSKEACRVENQQQEELMVYAIANTLGQFSTVKEVVFMIDGTPVSQIGGYLDLSQPIKPDYNM